MDFPEEMITELLIRLPLKSVIKSKCVCKDWNNLISMAEFRRYYQSRYYKTCPIGFVYHPKRRDSQGWAVNNPVKFLCTSNIDKEELGLCHNLLEFGEVVGSSKGLLLILYCTNYCVYDPLTRKQYLLPNIIYEREYIATGFICKEREQNFPKKKRGNGSYLTYKVVLIGLSCFKTRATREKRETYVHEVTTFSSETRKWHKSTMKAASYFDFEHICRAKVIGGVLHWEDNRGKNIMAYDPEDQAGRAKLIETPTLKNFVGLKISGTQDGRLLCMKVSKRDVIGVWVLGRKFERGSYLDEDIIDHTQWTLIHKIVIKEITKSLANCRFYELVGINPQDSSVIYLRLADKFISYNFEEKRVENVISKGEGERHLASTYTNFEWPSWPCLSSLF